MNSQPTTEGMLVSNAHEANERQRFGHVPPLGIFIDNTTLPITQFSIARNTTDSADDSSSQSDCDTRRVTSDDDEAGDRRAEEDEQDAEDWVWSGCSFPGAWLWMTQVDDGHLTRGILH